MEISAYIAKIVALIYLSVSLGFFFSGKYYKRELVKMLDNAGLMYLGGVMALMIGFIIISVHNTWVKNWTVLVTRIGWLSLVKGVWLLVFPGTSAWFKPMFKADRMAIFGIVTLALGLVFGYFGFLAQV